MATSLALILAQAHGAGAEADYSAAGADACVVCHGAGMPQEAVSIFHTPHGSRLDPAAPFAELQCETCHGPGGGHVESIQHGGDQLPPRTFGNGAATPVPEQNAVCLDCHSRGARTAWFGSVHEAQNVSCASCHQVHSPRDRVFDPLGQQEACFACHEQRRSDTFKRSSHPLRFGAMTCSGCHDPHNADNAFHLVEPTVNDTCFTCHADKRGPYLWEHAPASEDCSLCHDPHGSNHRALLNRRPPLLCQQCHAAAGHPSLALTAAEFGDAFNNRFLLGRGCVNCHSQVHGSNHPSGATLHR